jgi:hypothetical protein
MKSTTLRPCCFSIADTVRIRSTKRLPSGLCIPKIDFLQMTTWRMARSASLLVGSIPFDADEGPHRLEKL